MERDEIIRAWLNEEPASGEVRATEDFATLEKMVNALAEHKAPEFPVEAELSRFHSHKPQGKQRSLLPRLWQVAAAVLVLVAIGWTARQFLSGAGTTETLTAAHETRALYLPDSSEVILNGNSKLSYHADSWAQHREVELEGEGYFRVRKGSQFEVKSPQGTVTVLGTQFDVFDRGAVRTVRCFEGRVGVSGPSETILEAGQGVTLAENVPQPITTHLSQPDWLGSQREIYSWPLRLVLEEIARVYTVTIHAESLDLSSRFTGKIPLKELESTLKIIAGSTGATYRIEKNEVYFMAK